MIRCSTTMSFLCFPEGSYSLKPSGRFKVRELCEAHPEMWHLVDEAGSLSHETLVKVVLKNCGVPYGLLMLAC